MKKTSAFSALKIASLATALFVATSFGGATQAKADVVTATWLAGSALALVLFHDPSPVTAPLHAVSGHGYSGRHHGHDGHYSNLHDGHHGDYHGGHNHGMGHSHGHIVTK